MQNGESYLRERGVTCRLIVAGAARQLRFPQHIDQISDDRLQDLAPFTECLFHLRWQSRSVVAHWTQAELYRNELSTKSANVLAADAGRTPPPDDSAMTHSPL
jgi:hypothetical protein